MANVCYFVVNFDAIIVSECVLFDFRWAFHFFPSLDEFVIRILQIKCQFSNQFFGFYFPDFLNIL